MSIKKIRKWNRDFRKLYIVELIRSFLSQQGRGTAKELPNFSRRAVYMHYELDGDLTKGFIIRRVVSENVQDLTLNGDEYRAGKVVAAHSR